MEIVDVKMIDKLLEAGSLIGSGERMLE